MFRFTRHAFLLAVIGTLSGCANYDGSRFNYQSGGIPFLGMTFAVGHDDSSDDIQVLRADGSEKTYASAGDRTRLAWPLPKLIRKSAADGSVEIPAGSERLLREDDYEAQLNQL